MANVLRMDVHRIRIRGRTNLELDGRNVAAFGRPAVSVAVFDSVIIRLVANWAGFGVVVHGLIRHLNLFICVGGTQ